MLAAVLADGTNLGLERVAKASQGVSYAQLAWTHNRYLSKEYYGAELAVIVDAHLGRASDRFFSRNKNPIAGIVGNRRRRTFSGAKIAFDDCRADEAFRIIADMAQGGQGI